MAATRATRQAPAQAARRPRMRYASFEARVAALLLDAIVIAIIAALLLALGSLIVLVSSNFERVDPSETAINLFWACVGAIAPACLLYVFVGFCWKGQTIGKSVMNIMVIRNDGRPLGVIGAVGRVIGLLIYPLFLSAGALGAYALRSDIVMASIPVGVAVLLVIAGLLWAAFDRHRRCLHDRIAGTIVVRVG
jgi:uncharacterized RDD family membrane protein YckC